MKKKNYLFGKSLLMIAFLLLVNCREEQDFVKHNNILASKISISRKKMSEIPGLEKSVIQIKDQLLSNNTTNKGLEEFDIDEDNILVMDLQEKGRIISVVVNEPVLQVQYSVTNLNIVKVNGVESYFLTKYIPSDGKPFYNYSDFVGTVQYLDLNGNLLSTLQSNKSEYISISMGCTQLLIFGCDHCSNINWEIIGTFNLCEGGGGNSGNYNSPYSGSNGGYTPPTPGGSGNGTGTSSQTNLPNIPSQDAVDRRRYQSFLDTMLTPQELLILKQNQNLSDKIFYYQKNKDFSDASRLNSKWFMNFFGQTPDAEPFSIFNFGIKYIDQNTDIVSPNNIFLRTYALDKFLKQNPDGLLDIPCLQLPHWQDISSYPIPQGVKSKINAIPNQNSYWSSWAVTDLESGAGPRVNMDLFPVKINSLPNKPGTNQKYTASEFFDFFRKNINLFAEKFEPIEDNYYNIHDTALWNSSNPLGALIHINIPVDDGTVICSGFSSNTWIFTTIKAPLSWSYDGVHPVAGNRKFSYYTDPNDGSVTIYTRGVDRLSSINSSDTPLINFLMESTAFLGADQLWSGMQTKLSNYINSNGGSAIKVNPEVYRPNYSIIKDYLKGKSSLAALGCK